MIFNRARLQREWTLNLAVVAKHAESFIREFSDENPLRTVENIISPRCKPRVLELSLECCIRADLVRHRMWQDHTIIMTFDDVTPTEDKLPESCFGCRQGLPSPRSRTRLSFACTNCRQIFCFDDAIFLWIGACPPTAQAVRAGGILDLPAPTLELDLEIFQVWMESLSRKS